MRHETKMGRKKISGWRVHICRILCAADSLWLRLHLEEGKKLMHSNCAAVFVYFAIFILGVICQVWAVSLEYFFIWAVCPDSVFLIRFQKEDRVFQFLFLWFADSFGCSCYKSSVWYLLQLQHISYAFVVSISLSMILIRMPTKQNCFVFSIERKKTHLNEIFRLEFRFGFSIGWQFRKDKNDKNEWMAET